MAFYDAENFFDDMLALFRANLNAKCTALNTEKSDTLLKTDFVDDDFIINFNDEVINKNAFIYFGWADVSETDSNANCLAESFKMFFSIMDICTNDETLEMKKLLRYTRALAEIAQDNATKFRTSTLEIETFKPITILDNTGSDWYRGAGIHVTGDIG